MVMGIRLPNVPELHEAPEAGEAEGCIQCMQGSKLVLFITGKCHWACDYCPLSENRKESDFMFANERRCTDYDEVIEEARAMRATGAGITGGDPMMDFNHTLEGIRRLRSEFGPTFHMHLYTSIAFRLDWAPLLAEAGLDEIRFHLLDFKLDPYRKIIRACADAGIHTGVEVPCPPDMESEMFALLENLRDTGISFLNLNELEITVGNHDQMDVRGFNLSDGITAGAAGSSELAERLRDRVRAADVSAPDPDDGGIRAAYGYHLKFCTAVYKDAGQLRRRFLRRGEATIAPHETLTDDGTLLFGAIYSSSEDAQGDIEEIRDVCDLPATFLHYDEAESRIEIPLVIAEEFAEEIDAPVALVEVHPTHERLEMTLIWLNEHRPE
ncbi:MAG TPA: radical SAM protein [Candidatus Thalassarchaeaceae archaeon]|nr:radical SAM protein [Candidatus Thalassarchaeaceae archaeon]